MKSVLIDEDLHAELKRVSNESGIKIKDIVAKGIKEYLRKIRTNFLEEEEEYESRRA